MYQDCEIEFNQSSTQYCFFVDTLQDELKRKHDLRPRPSMTNKPPNQTYSKIIHYKTTQRENSLRIDSN